ncbi:Uncharacterised protein [Aedoeadaptatus ivorii]|uniref:Twitching motility protein PilT n=1 Tax=Aedoeadaptatus ivorii TaxID=54006 RepID=A0A448V115_9FIRM|nr:hypothetical protein [Peptoniphilus ivorii]MDQ0507719.1 myosin-crossreactive antigen [Peptoniphilus ivorii]VEJ35477.1 Uncharacterised protein [Peptoniphilus ivorii]
MIQYILGAKGAGKTKWLIDHANEDLHGGNGNIAFVEVDDDHIFSLDYNVRLINATEYGLENLDQFYGFLCGMLAMDYDLEKIYVDGIYKVLDLSVEDLETLRERLEALDIENREIYINVDYVESEIPDALKEYAQEVSLEA